MKMTSIAILISSATCVALLATVPAAFSVAPPPVGTDPLDVLAPEPSQFRFAAVESTQQQELSMQCTNFPGTAITLDVPTAGRVVVSANVWMHINHVHGSRDSGMLRIGTSPTDCGSPSEWAAPFTVAADQPTDSYSITVPVRTVYGVEPGAATWYVNGYLDVPGSAAGDSTFWTANVQAVFYPN